jgi:hypothetical protein
MKVSNTSAIVGTSVATVVILAALYVLGMYLYRKVTAKHLRLHYHIKDSQVFRNQFQPAGPNVPTGQSASMDLTTFPLLDASGKSAGILESTASLFVNGDGTTDVFQSLNYILKDGSMSARLYFRNSSHSIFPESSEYSVPIVSGSGAYAHVTGMVNICVNEDGSRDLHITYNK